MRRLLLESEKRKNSFIWKETPLNPFNELIVSWNAERPTQGAYLIQVSLFIGKWSPWVNYAFWGSSDQCTFKKHLHESSLNVYQDTIEVLNGYKVNGFKVRVVAEKNSSLEKFKDLYASTTDHSTHTITPTVSENIYVNLEVKGLSQIALKDERHLRLCSPTSTTAVIRFLTNSLDLSPLEFANHVVDSTFDIYGNWILNAAQASYKLKNIGYCYVVRFTAFDQIIDQLRKGYPVVVSVKGPLNGSAAPYESGHLLVVKGYDSKTQEVFCMDPAFPTNELTHVKYALSDFLTAWSRRQGIAYVFEMKK
jgi:hypothetical protein